MDWTPEAEAAVRKVPFFVRKKVRAKVEKEAVAAGKKVVSLADVEAAQARFLSKMSSEVKGYRLETCFGQGGCPNPANSAESLFEKINALLEKADLLSFLKQRISGDLKFHHEFKVTLAECPNACSQPQIKDIGIIGAAIPTVTLEECTLCEECVQTCPEECVSINGQQGTPDIDWECCLKCGQCIRVCPTGTIGAQSRGFRVQLGGKLGRHPRLAKELDGIFSEDEVLAIVEQCIKFYKEKSKHGERFAELLNNADIEEILKF